MKIANLLFLIISTLITILVFPSGEFVDNRPDMINYFFIGYFIWMFIFGGIYYLINLFILKDKIYFAFGVCLSMIAIISILLGVIKEVVTIDTISVSLWFINLIVFLVLGSLGFWFARIVMHFFRK